jgi:HlyD family secretion protein
MHNRRYIIPIVIILALIAIASWYFLIYSDQDEGDLLQGSGTVEVVEVVIVPELAGRVAEVFISEGDHVQTGTPLFRLEGELLEAQRAQAITALDSASAGLGVAHAAKQTAQTSFDVARTQYEMEVTAARQQETPIRTSAWYQNLPSEFSLPVWYFVKSEDISAAQAEVDAADEALVTAQAKFEAVLSSAGSADILEVEMRLAQAQAAFLIAQDVLDRTTLLNDQVLEEHAQDLFTSANAELEAAQSDFNQLLSDKSAEEVLESRAQLAIAQERYDTAWDRYTQLLTGEDSLRVQAARANLALAEAGLTQADAQITQAESAVAQAQAQLNLIDIQMGKLIIQSPVTGVVLNRNIEPGEIVQPGAVAITIGQLDELTITVYIPEDRYGQIDLGMHADVSVDSFPNLTFDASVVRIADRAEFTPRNVQTEEGRRTTVFAVKLVVDDPQGMLKPGMPADVVFEE